MWHFVIVSSVSLSFSASLFHSIIFCVCVWVCSFLPLFFFIVSMKSSICCKCVICVHHWLRRLLVLLFCFCFRSFFCYTYCLKCTICGTMNSIDVLWMKISQQIAQVVRNEFRSISRAQMRVTTTHTHTYRNVTTSLQQQQQWAPKSQYLTSSSISRINTSEKWQSIMK